MMSVRIFAASRCVLNHATSRLTHGDFAEFGEQRTIRQRVSASEPLLQRGRVKLENLGQTYRDRIAAAQRPGSTSNPTPTASAGTAAKP